MGNNTGLPCKIIWIDCDLNITARMAALVDLGEKKASRLLSMFNAATISSPILVLQFLTGLKHSFLSDYMHWLRATSLPTFFLRWISLRQEVRNCSLIPFSRILVLGQCKYLKWSKRTPKELPKSFVYRWNSYLFGLLDSNFNSS